MKKTSSKEVTNS